MTKRKTKKNNNKPIVKTVVATRRRRRNRANRPRARMAMSEAGVNFLKCAMAAPDFSTEMGHGVPDTYNGRILAKKYQSNITQSFPADEHYWLLVAPAPGIMYAHCTTTGTVAPGQAGVTGSGHWQLVSYPGILDVTAFNAFRIISNSVEIIPTSNMMQFGGSITVWKTNLVLSSEQFDNATPPPSTYYKLVLKGLASIAAAPPASNTTMSFIDGCFSQAFNQEPDWQFSGALRSSTGNGMRVLPDSDTSAFNYGNGADSPLIRGFGTLESIVVKISSGAGAVNNAIIKTWQCVEYQAAPNSVLYSFATRSPDYDPVALSAYREVARSLPVAVTKRENANMWQRVLNILRMGSSLVSNVGGPIGLAAGLVGKFADLFV